MLDSAPTPDVADRTALGRRLLRVLMAAQVLAGLGGAAASATALLAVAMTGSESLASLPLAVLVVGSSAIVVPVSALSRRAGRRVGLSAALALAAAGAIGVVAAGVLSSFALLLVAIAAFGAGNTAVMLARYAAADLSTPALRGRAIGGVVFATTFGAVAGPNLLGPAGRLATAVGLPALTGLFLIATAAFALAALLLLAWLRPDPLRIAAAFGAPEQGHEPAAGLPPSAFGAPEQGPEPAAGLPPSAFGAPEQRDEPAAGLPLRRLLAAPGAKAGLTTLVVANFVMVAVMAMAPVHMRGQGHGLEVIGLVVSVHIAGMFAPAPLTGRLTDRFGALTVAVVGAALLVGAGALSATAGRNGALSPSAWGFSASAGTPG